MSDELVRRNEYVVDNSTLLVDFLLKKCLFLHSDDEVLALCHQRLLLKNEELIIKNLPLVPGERITLLTPQSLEPQVSETIELLYEDEYFFAVSKPSPLPVHPTGKYYFNTLSSLIQRKLGLVSSYPYNRLDRETSGIVLFAKKPEYVQLLQNATIDKWYYALVFGVFEGSTLIDVPLLQGTKGSLRDHIFVDAQGRKSMTQVTSLAHNNTYTLVEAKLLTGRKHQIRAHLAHMGFPVVGDKQYGSFPELLEKYASSQVQLEDSEIMKKVATTRQLLHCHKVEFLHPKNGNLVSISNNVKNMFLDFLIKEGIDLF